MNAVIKEIFMPKHFYIIKLPIYTQWGRNYFFYCGHLIAYNYIMDDYGNAIEVEHMRLIGEFH